MEEIRLLKALFLETKQNQDGTNIHTFLASSDMLDRQHEIVTAGGWQLKNYCANPVVLDSHRYDSIEHIIGRAEVRDVERGLEADITFAGTDKGRMAEQLVREGMLKAVSVGFLPLKIEQSKDDKEPLKHLEKELLEISVVAVPADPEALLIRGLNRMAMPPHNMPMAPEDMAWDGAAQVKEADIPDMKIMAAWMDTENPDVKSSYKLPHHLAGNHNVVWRGVAAAMAAFMGARTPVNIPEADRRGVYTHLARHYRQFEKEIPEFKTLEDLSKLDKAAIEGLFWESEIELIVETFIDIEEASKMLREHFGVDIKIGRVISRANEDSLRQAVSLISGVLDTLSSEPQSESMPDISEPLQNILTKLNMR